MTNCFGVFLLSHPTLQENLQWVKRLSDTEYLNDALIVAGPVAWPLHITIHSIQFLHVYTWQITSPWLLITWAWAKSYQLTRVLHSHSVFSTFDWAANSALGGLGLANGSVKGSISIYGINLSEWVMYFLFKIVSNTPSVKKLNMSPKKADSQPLMASGADYNIQCGAPYWCLLLHKPI